MEGKNQQVRECGGGAFDVLNVWTKRRLTEIIESKTGPLKEAAKETLEAWELLISTKSAAEKNAKTKKRRRKARDAARKTLPITKDGRQAALAELQRRKRPRLDPGVADNDGHHDDGYAHCYDDGYGQSYDDGYAQSYEGHGQAHDPFADDSYLIAESDYGPQFVLTDAGSGTPPVRTATAIARVARLDFLYDVAHGRSMFNGMSDACAELGVCLACPATHKGALPTGAMPYSDGRFGGWEDKALAAWRCKRVSGMRGHWKQAHPKLATRSSQDSRSQPQPSSAQQSLPPPLRASTSSSRRAQTSVSPSSARPTSSRSRTSSSEHTRFRASPRCPCASPKCPRRGQWR